MVKQIRTIIDRKDSIGIEEEVNKTALELRAVDIRYVEETEEHYGKYIIVYDVTDEGVIKL